MKYKWVKTDKIKVYYWLSQPAQKGKDTVYGEIPLGHGIKIR